VGAVAKQAGWAGAFDVVGLVLRYGLILLIARLLGPLGLGLYGLALAFANGITVVAALGLDHGMLRFVPYHRARKEPGEIVGVFLFATLLVAVLASGAALALFFGASSLETWWGQPGLGHAARMIALAVPFIALGQVWRAGLRGFQNLRLAVFLNQILVPLATLVGLLAILLLRPGEELAAVGGATLAYWLVGLISLAILTKRIRQVNASPTYRPSTWMRFALPLSLEGGLLFFVLWTDQLMIGWFLSAADVGVYISAVRVAALVALPLLAVNTVFAPMVAGLHAQSDRPTLQTTYARLTWSTALLGICIALLLWITGRWILGMFGPAFLAGNVALAILIGGQAVNACTGSSRVVLGMTGHAGWRLTNAALAATLNVGLNCLLIPQWGIAGAAAATAISLGVINVLQVFEVRRIVGLWAYDRSAWPVIMMQSGRAGRRAKSGLAASAGPRE
jgi:O-antigen/teichoic acid export membrane protein